MELTTERGEWSQVTIAALQFFPFKGENSADLGWLRWVGVYPIHSFPYPHSLSSYLLTFLPSPCDSTPSSTSSLKMASTTSVLTNLIIAPPKQTIAQRIEHWVLGEDDTILFQELAETANAWKDSVGYRWQSKSTLSRQDSALYDYRRLISLYLKKGGMDDIDMLFSAGEESNDKFVFPSDSKLLTEYIGW
jgi:hypothetical protein